MYSDILQGCRMFSISHRDPQQLKVGIVCGPKVGTMEDFIPWHQEAYYRASFGAAKAG